VKNPNLFFFLICFLLLFTHLGFVAEANSFLNGAPTLLNQVSALPIEFKGESRYRFELRNNFNFNDTTYEDDAINLFRFRLSAKMDAGPYAHFFVEGQSALSFSESGLNKSSAFANQFDLRQLYAHLKSPVKKVPLEVRVGRQVLSYGDQRFVGGFEWSNVARVFNAVKLIYPFNDKFQMELFISEPVRVDKEKVDPAVHHDHFYGIYSSFKPIKDHIVDTFLFIRHDSDRQIQLKEYTAGNRFKGKIKDFDYGTEYALQFGKRSHNDIAAWAFHQEAGYTVTPIFLKPRLSAEFNHGSGDDDPADGRFENFDNLFPTNHDKYGFMDFLSLRNTNNVRLGITIPFHSRLSVSTDFHWFFLDTNKSAWFNAAQAVIRAGNPNASKELGQELDLFLKWKGSDLFDVLLGYSHFFAGQFLEDTGASDDADFFYVQPTFRF
jgi:hypothetical protein